MKLILIVVLVSYIRGQDVNIALNKPVYVDAVVDGEDTLQYLVDGNPKTCADTGPAVVGAALVIDLGEPVHINELYLRFPRTCDDTVSGMGCNFKKVVAKIGNSPDPDDEGNHYCFTVGIKDVAKYGSVTRQCEDGQEYVGRYVMVHNKDRKPGAIHLCEMRNKNDYQSDIAYNRTVTSVNTVDGEHTETYPFLVDGDTNTCADSGPLADDPAFVIDLGEVKKVGQVNVVIADGCKAMAGKTECGVEDFTVTVGNSPIPGDDLNTQCFWVNLTRKELKRVRKPCDNGPIYGRYIILQKNGPQRSIYLCQVSSQVSVNTAYHKPITSVGSTGGEETYPLMLDGNPWTCSDSGNGSASASFIIDFGEPHDIGRVNMGFAKKCGKTMYKKDCSIENTKVTVGDSPDPDDENNDVCFHLEEHPMNDPGVLVRQCQDGPLTGRYVIITKLPLPRKLRAIHLCEVRVHPEEMTSYGRPIIGEGIWPGDDTANLLTDGDPATCADHGPLTNNPAFIIDLGETKEVTSVEYTLPADKCVNSISGEGCDYKKTVIKVGDSRDPDDESNVLCHEINLKRKRVKGQTVSGVCANGPINGRFIIIETIIPKMKQMAALQLCEVAVY
ncbi:uncharacterized protein LOC144452810 [Glandiceps talaboti]